MKRFFALVLTVVLCLSLAACGECKHEWQEADCENPKTCSLCGEIEGEALGHDWQGGDCQNPQVCARCGKEGETVDTHQEGEWEKGTIDTVNGLQNFEKKCTVCGKVLETKTEPANVLHDDDFFLMDAAGLNERLKQAFTTISEVKMEAQDASENGEAYCVITVDGEQVTKIALLNDEGEQNPAETMKFRSVNALVPDVRMGGPVLVALIQALDPEMNRETAEELAVKIAKLSYGEERVSLENNGIGYVAHVSTEGVMMSAFVYTGETVDIDSIAPAPADK